MPAQDDQSPQAFSYNDAKLPSPTNHFRLLHLRPSPEAGAPIVCDISCHPINAPEPFKALSYTWGPDDRSAHKVLLGGGEFMGLREFGITESLDGALRRIRRRDGTVTIWIDQICINQDDAVEKGPQVGLMEEIYSAADEVLVWLGPAGSNSDAVMELWRNVGLEARRLGLESYWTTENIGQLRAFRRDEVLDENDAMYNFRGLINDSLPQFRSLLRDMANWAQRAWFSRVWVVQEFALPTTVPVFLCGEKKVDADLVYLALKIFDLSALQLLRDEPLRTRSREEVQDLINSPWSANISLFTTIRRQKQTASTRRQRQAVTGASTEAPPGDCMMDILRKLYVDGEMHATDDRDRIFAVLGLASDSDQLGLHPEYTGGADCSPTYTKVARALLKKAKRLELLSWAEFPKTSPLPTWAPDWRSVLKPSYHPLIIQRVGQNALFSPSRASPPDFVDTANESILGIKGIAICTIERVGDQWLDDAPERDAAVVYHLATIDDFCERSVSMGHSIYPSSDRQAQAVWRVPIGGIYHFGFGEHIRAERSEQSMGDLYTFAVRNSRLMGRMGTSEDGRFVPDYDSQECDGSSYLASMDYMTGKRPFLAREGYVGMGPKDMRPGDKVVVFAGAHIPHVLREDIDNGTDKHCTFVGKAYCDGIMDGEAWDDSKVKAFYLF